MSVAAADQLATIAEIAVTVAGLAGIVAVLRPSSDKSGEDVRRIAYMVVVTSCVIVTSFLPSAFIDLGFSEVTALTFSCAVLGVSALFLDAVFIYNIVRGALSIKFPKISFLIIIILSITGLSLILAASSILLAASYGLLLIGEVVFVLLGLWLFFATFVWARDI